jgi:two-component system, response regulator
MNYTDIVIVEDNAHDVEMIMDAFNDIGKKISTLVFRDGAEAAKYFFDPGNKFISEQQLLPKLILLDLKIPKINGLEVLKLLKSNEETKYIPVVVFTSSNETRDRVESYQSGANSYLVKPLDADMFSDYIKQIVNYWAIMNINVPQTVNV